MLSHSLELAGTIEALEPELLELGVLFLEGAGSVAAADAAACLVLERDARRVVGSPLLELLTEASLGDFARLLASPRAATVHARTRETGRRIALYLSELAAPSAGRALRVCAIAEVDTWTSAAEARALVQLRRTFDAVVAGLAHEVRNPLATILSLAEAAMAEEPESSRISQALAAIPFMVSRIESLIAQSQEYSRPGLPDPRWVSVDTLVDAALALGATLAKSARVVREIPSDLTPVHVDAGQIERVLLNLVENACRAAKSTVWIRARATEDGARVQVDVVDDGPGVLSEIRGQIFDPFFTTRPKGVGLGLAIARDLARLSGGDLTLWNPGPKDTTFRVLLPAEVVEAPSEPRSGGPP